VDRDFSRLDESYLAGGHAFRVTLALQWVTPLANHVRSVADTGIRNNGNTVAGSPMVHGAGTYPDSQASLSWAPVTQNL
jgi:hypothetical protein